MSLLVFTLILYAWRRWFVTDTVLLCSAAAAAASRDDRLPGHTSTIDQLLACALKLPGASTT